MEKLGEYEKSVPHLWVVDPRLQNICVYSAGGLRFVEGDVIATSSPRREAGPAPDKPYPAY